ncbi:MAG: GGDEF domain-containing protein [Wenzhouxiangella sp.]
MSEPTRAESAPKPRLLFADSSRLMRRAAKRILGDEFHVITAEDAEAAWVALADDSLIQVVFHDLQEEPQPGQPNLLERIRSSADRRIRETPLVMVTDEDVSEDRRQQALERGISDFITKPFRSSELIARARAHANSAEARHRLHLLQKQHNRDTETGLGNRRYFFERLAQALSFARRHTQALSLVHVHLDGLNRAMQRLDERQRLRRMEQLGQALGQAIRHEDTVYRTGVESFSFILPGTPPDGAETVRCRLIPELDALGMLDGKSELRTRARFVVQAPVINLEESLVESLRRIRESMGNRLVERPAPTPLPSSRNDAADLSRLLELARRGDLGKLKDRLPELIDQLKPLLDLAEQLKRPDARSDADGDQDARPERQD